MTKRIKLTIRETQRNT